jgi:hypothetical protein
LVVIASTCVDHGREVVARERPTRSLGSSILRISSAGNPSISTCPKARALFDDGTGPDDAARAERAVIADDGAWLDDRAGTDLAAVDHGARSDCDAVLDDQLVVGKQVQDGVLPD